MDLRFLICKEEVFTCTLHGQGAEFLYAKTTKNNENTGWCNFTRFGLVIDNMESNVVRY